MGIPVSLKVHIVFEYVVHFCQKHNNRLGLYSEHSVESSYYDFKPFWEKFLQSCNGPSSLWCENTWISAYVKCSSYLRLYWTTVAAIILLYKYHNLWSKLGAIVFLVFLIILHNKQGTEFICSIC